MGIGLGPETEIKDAIIIELNVILSIMFTFPIFWQAYRLFAREERLSQVAPIPPTYIATATIV